MRDFVEADAEVAITDGCRSLGYEFEVDGVAAPAATWKQFAGQESDLVRQPVAVMVSAVDSRHWNGSANPRAAARFVRLGLVYEMNVVH